MSDDYITVPVAKGVEDLIPTFMRNRAEEVERLRNALDGHELQKSDASLQPRISRRLHSTGEFAGFFGRGNNFWR